MIFHKEYYGGLMLPYWFDTQERIEVALRAIQLRILAQQLDVYEYEEGYYDVTPAVLACNPISFELLVYGNGTATVRRKKEGESNFSSVVNAEYPAFFVLDETEFGLIVYGMFFYEAAQKQKIPPRKRRDALQSERSSR